MSTIVPFKTPTRRKSQVQGPVSIKCRSVGCRHRTRDPYAAKWVYLEDTGGYGADFIGWWEQECLENLAGFWADPLPPYLPQRLVRRASFVPASQKNLKPLKR
jgi:hypothetical protein